MTEPRHRPRPENYGTYADCWPYLDLAIKHGGIRIPVGRASAAMSFRHRLYRARKLLQKQAAATAKPGELPSTPYDTAIIKLIPHTAKGDEPADLAIEIRAPEAARLSAVTDLNGNPIDFEGESPDELSEAARQLAADLGLDLE